MSLRFYVFTYVATYRFVILFRLLSAISYFTLVYKTCCFQWGGVKHFASAMSLHTGQSLRPFLTIHPEGTSVSVQQFVCTERQH